MKALFPGSFDPFTIGHEALVRRSLKMFDEIVVAVGDNKQKHTMFSLEERMAVVRAVFKDECRVKVDSYQDLTVDYCKKNDIQYIVRGVRNEVDFRYESDLARINSMLAPQVETIFLLPDKGTELISSSLVRELIQFGKDCSQFLPQGIVLPKH